MMTHEEKMQSAADLGLKLRTFLDSIKVPEKPELPDKVGYKWQLTYTFGGDAFAWESVPDPDAKGTQENPFDWISGMATMVDAWYVYEGNTYVCIQAGNPTEITDTAYFERM